MRRIALPLLLVLAIPAMAAPRIDAVAAGDPTETSAVLWARAADGDQPVTLRVDIASDPAFAAVLRQASATTVADDDFTVKVPLDGLRPGTRYHYRFCAATCEAGRFTTAPGPDGRTRLRFGVTGDADGKYRPYPAAGDLGDQDLDFFVFLGDTMYETESASRKSPATLALRPDSDPPAVAQGLADYFRKYRENILGIAADGAVDPAGWQGLRVMRQATGHYTMMDNHELGSGALAAGGAPPGAAGGNREPPLDANATGPFNNQSSAFRALTRAFHAYHPTRVSLTGPDTGPIVNQPDDPRSHNTPRNWFAQSWGANAIYVQTDGRTYRDARMMRPDARLGEADADDTGPRADNPDRTMLGRTQIAWLKTTLLAAQQAGTTWKFVAISTPMDQVGTGVRVAGARWPALGTQFQDGKSWFGAYRAERNELLAFIAANRIGNVVFLTTDDHFVRVTTLRYRASDGTMAQVPGAIHIVSGPIGAGGPDAFLPTSQDKVEQALALRLRTQAETEAPPNGLPVDFPGLSITHRRFGEPGGPPRPLDFFIPDHFSYTVLQVDPDATLTVEAFGVPAYKPDSFPQDRPMPARIMGFRIVPR